VTPGKTFFNLGKTLGHCFTLPKKTYSSIRQSFDFSDDDLQERVFLIIDGLYYSATLRMGNINRSKTYWLEPGDLPARKVFIMQWSGSGYKDTQDAIKGLLADSYRKVSYGEKPSEKVTFTHVEPDTFLLTAHYNSEVPSPFPEMGAETSQPEERPKSMTPSTSAARESKEMAEEMMDLRKGGATRRFKWYRMPDGRKIHTKYSKWYDGDNHQYFWYGVTPKSLEIAKEVGLDVFGFITGKEGCVIVDLETLLDYVTAAQASVEKEDLSTIRHFHLFINRGMRLIYNRTDGRSFESEFVSFDDQFK